MFQFVYALEATYPEILGYTINDKSEFVDYVSYAFSFLVSIGGVILVAVIIMAGIDFILAGGDSSKVSQAKKRIKDGFIGLIILLFSYLILNTINPAIIGIENPDLEKCYGGGIIITIEKPDQNPKKMCIWGTMSTINIDGEINPDLTEWMFKEGELKEVWVFDDHDFKGNSIILFQDNDPINSEPLNPNPMPKNIKSIFILRKNPGLYLYDKIDWGIETNPPLFVGLKDFSDLNNVYLYSNYSINYSDKTCSYLLIKNKENEELNYGAVLFEDTNYSGKCLLARRKPMQIIVMGQTPQGSFTPTGQTITKLLDSMNSLNPFGLDSVNPKNNTISSVITYKSMENKDYGKIILYNKSNCSIDNTIKDSCEVLVNVNEGSVVRTGSGSYNPSFNRPCPSFEGEIKSVSIEGNAGFVIRSTDNYCMYFDHRNNVNNCINLENTKVFYESGVEYNATTDQYEPVIKVRPLEIMVFPLEK